MRDLLCTVAVFICTPTALFAQDCTLICNGDFDSLQVTATVALLPSAQTPCWHTTEPDDIIEVWHTGYNGIYSYSGTQFVELNAYEPATLYQDITVPLGAQVSISFAHHGRGGTDSMSVSLGPVGGPYTQLGIYGDGETSWGYYTANYTVPALWGTDLSVRFTSVYWGYGDPGVGNMLDAVTVCATAITQGVEQVDPPAAGIQLYPNPAGDHLIIASLTPLGEGAFTVVDGSGREVRRLRPDAMGGTTTLDVRDLPRGIYLIRHVDAQGMVRNGRFAKE